MRIAAAASGPRQPSPYEQSPAACRSASRAQGAVAEPRRVGGHRLVGAGIVGPVARRLATEDPFVLAGDDLRREDRRDLPVQPGSADHPDPAGHRVVVGVSGVLHINRQDPQPGGVFHAMPKVTPLRTWQ